MKLILAIVQQGDVKTLLSALVKNGYRATKLASTGGFLKAHSTTLLIGIEEEKTQEILKIIKENCSKRTILDPIPPYSLGIQGEYIYMDPVEYVIGGATVFVLDAFDYSKTHDK